MKKLGLILTPWTIALLSYSSPLNAQQSNPLIGQLQTDELPKANVNMDSLLKNATEVVSKRTPYSSYFLCKDKKVVVHNSSQPINYVDAQGNLQPIKIELKQNGDGWLADQQPNICSVKRDGSTAISIGNGKQIAFNIDTKLNGEWFSEAVTSVTNKQIVFALGSNIQKRISFTSNRIETDYIISSPSSKGITISEEVKYPSNCQFTEDKNAGKEIDGKWRGNIVLTSNGVTLSRFTVPLCYDAAGRTCIGYYKLVSENGKHILKTIVPDDWLKNATYPVTVDPQVTGPLAFWTGGNMPTCFLPTYSNQDSMQVTIPGGTTATALYVSTSMQSNFAVSPIVYTNHGYIIIATMCGKSPTLHNPASGAVYSELFLGSYNFFSPLLCCYQPSCSDQTFWLRQENARDSAGSGCDTDYIYYSGTPVLFEAYVVGQQDTAMRYTITPNKTCSNDCKITMKADAEWGVPPYKISHPWLSKDTVLGKFGGCTSFSAFSIPMTIPGCPSFCGKADTILVPPPVVVDACGDTAINTFTSQKLIINPTPKITVTPDSMAVCSGNPVLFTLTPCIAGTTVSWTGTNSTSGNSTIINPVLYDTTAIPQSIKYTATVSMNGCLGDTATMKAIVNPEPTISVSPTGLDTVDLGNSVQLNATGGTTYAWFPSAGLSCTSCPNPVASPTVTTTYYVSITNAEGCSKSDSVRLPVIDVNINIPNVFTPNSSDINNEFYIQNLKYHPNSQIDIYDRWGVLVYHSDNYPNNWNGGTQSDGVYYYVLTLNNSKKYDGFFQIIR